MSAGDVRTYDAARRAQWMALEHERRVPVEAQALHWLS